MDCLIEFLYGAIQNLYLNVGFTLVQLHVTWPGRPCENLQLKILFQNSYTEFPFLNVFFFLYMWFHTWENLCSLNLQWKFVNIIKMNVTYFYQDRYRSSILEIQVAMPNHLCRKTLMVSCKNSLKIYIEGLVSLIFPFQPSTFYQTDTPNFLSRISCASNSIVTFFILFSFIIFQHYFFLL